MQLRESRFPDARTGLTGQLALDEPSLSDSIFRPLGLGYAEIGSRIALYADNHSRAQGVHPTLRHSLRQIGSVGATRDWLAGLPSGAACLIEGHTDPANASHLRDFLRCYGVSRPKVQVIDLCDMPQVYQQLNLAPIEAQFRVANAADLRGVFAAESFHLVVQDFLLNCAPPCLHRAILVEAARVLVPGGLAFISFTCRAALAGEFMRTTTAVAEEHGTTWNDLAYSLRDFPVPMTGLESSQPQPKMVHLLLEPGSDCVIHVTAPHGNFEFFKSRASILEVFAQAGLCLLESSVLEGVDSHGLRCLRHHCLLTKPSVSPSPAGESREV